MAKRFKIVLITLSVVILALATMSMGMTLAIWTTSVPGGEETVAPAVNSPYSWNVWAKYFDIEVTSDGSTPTATVTSFHSDVAGLNLETVIIPQQIEKTVNGEKVTYTITEIGNQLFADVTLKSLPVKIVIPPSVTKIGVMTFADLTNLTTVEFGASTEDYNEACDIDDFAFFMCENLVSVIQNGRTLSYESDSDTAFFACGAITFS